MPSSDDSSLQPQAPSTTRARSLTTQGRLAGLSQAPTETQPLTTRAELSQQRCIGLTPSAFGPPPNEALCTTCIPADTRAAHAAAQNEFLSRNPVKGKNAPAQGDSVLPGHPGSLYKHNPDVETICESRLSKRNASSFDVASKRDFETAIKGGFSGMLGLPTMNLSHLNRYVILSVLFFPSSWHQNMAKKGLMVLKGKLRTTHYLGMVVQFEAKPKVGSSKGKQTPVCPVVGRDDLGALRVLIFIDHTFVDFKNDKKMEHFTLLQAKASLIVRHRHYRWVYVNMLKTPAGVTALKTKNFASVRSLGQTSLSAFPSTLPTEFWDRKIGVVKEPRKRRR